MVYYYILMIINCILLEKVSTATITEPMVDVHAILGQDASFYCKVENQGPAERMVFYKVICNLFFYLN